MILPLTHYLNQTNRNHRHRHRLPFSKTKIRQILANANNIDPEIIIFNMNNP